MKRFGERLADTSTRELAWLGGLWTVSVIVPLVAWLVFWR